MSDRVIYSRGFPYGAPLFMLRGGGLKRSGVLGWLREEGFRWDGQKYCWFNYMNREEATNVLKVLRDAYGCEIHAKDDLDPNYILEGV